MKKRDTRRDKALSFLRIGTILIAGAVFLYAAYQLVIYWMENYKSQQERNLLAEQAVTILAPTEIVSEEAGSDQQEASVSGKDEPTLSENLSGTIPLLVDFEILQQENPDIIAWIYSAGTPINYPVVQGDDNQYYLHRLTDGSYNASGTIFMDFRNSPTLSDLNSLIYGHNMKNDTMFGSLGEYKQQDYYDQHPQLWILTKEQAYRIDLIAGFVTASDSESYTIFETQEELNDYLSQAVQQSTFSADVNLESVQKIVTLSTCSYEYNTARYVVIGNLVPIEYGS